MVQGHKGMKQAQVKSTKLKPVTCRRGFVLTSDTFNKHCYNCKFRPAIDDTPANSEDMVCIAAFAAASALGKVNQIIRR